MLMLLMLLMLAGCVSSEQVQVSYDVSSGQSTYTSARSVVGALDMSQGLTSGQRIMWQAVASCAGHACTPSEVELVFYNDSDSELNLDSRRLQIIVDRVTYDWEDLDRMNEPAYYRVPPGVFFRATLTQTEFASLAEADQVRVLWGRSGARSIDVPFERRAAFRAFAERLGL